MNIKKYLLQGNNQDDTSPSRINKFKKAYVEKKFVQVEKKSVLRINMFQNKLRMNLQSGVSLSVKFFKKIPMDII